MSLLCSASNIKTLVRYCSLYKKMWGFFAIMHSLPCFKLIVFKKNSPL